MKLHKYAVTVEVAFLAPDGASLFEIEDLAWEYAKEELPVVYEEREDIDWGGGSLVYGADGDLTLDEAEKKYA